MFLFLCALWIVSEIVIAVATRTRRGGGSVQDRGSMLLLWIVNTAAISACQWIGAAVSAPLFNAAHWLSPASVALLIFALAIRWTAVLTLGRSFSANVAIRARQELKDDGLYRFVRHPSYLGLLLVFAAIGLHTRNWLALLVVLLPTTAALLYRIRVEEAALSAAFGQQYREYAQRTRRLVPGLY